MSKIIDASTRALEQTAASAAKTLGQLSASIEGQVAEMQSNQNTIIDQGNLIAANEKRIEIEVRGAAAEVRLQVREDRKAVLGQLLAEEGLVATTDTNLSELRQRAASAEMSAEAEVQKAVKSAEQLLHSAYGSEIAGLKADHKVEIAQLNANAQRDIAMLQALTKQVDALQETITANREAETARTQALAQSSITVNNGK